MSSLKVDARRREVFRLVSQNKTEEEIAKQLGVSRPTITRDKKYIRQHITEFGISGEEASRYLWQEFIDVLEKLTPWQKAKQLTKILQSLAIRKVKAEEKIEFVEVKPEKKSEED